MRKLAVQDPTLALLIVWTAGFFINLINGDDSLRISMVLVPELVLQGQWWRLLTFPLAPPVPSPLMAIIFIFFFMLYLTLGRNIEQVMGSWRYNLFLLTAWLGSAGGAMLGSFIGASPGFVDYTPMVTSMLFAFATFFPNYQILFMFVVPLKIKWLAIVGAVFVGFALLRGPLWGDRVWLLGQCLAYLIFCGPFMFGRLQVKQRRVRQDRQERSAAQQPFHVCARCGATEISHPERRFRICTECEPPAEYCDVCLPVHEHRREKTA
jgi:hypothetical protein